MENEELLPEPGEPGDAPMTQGSTPRKSNTRKRRIIIFVVVSLLNAGLLALLWTQLLTPAQSRTQGTSNADPLIGQAAPNFTLAALGAREPSTISLSNYKGQPVVLNIWNSTCVPCMAEAPLLQAQSQKTHAQGVVFLGLDFQDTQGDGLHFLQQYGITYQNVLDATGSVAINYGVTGTPETFFINRRGIIVAHVVGELTAQSIQSNLRLITR
jgi:cytochrome c biogenesis protein CcmG, thiol:disulfide interchange protein DsbE